MATSTIIDIAVIALIVIFALIGLFRGFIKTFFSFFGSIIALVLAIVLSSYLINFCEAKWGWVTGLSNSISGGLTSVFGSAIMDTTLAQATEETLSASTLTALLIKLVLSVKNDPSIDMYNTTINQVVSPAFAYYIAKAIAIIALYIIFRIILYIIKRIFFNLHKFKPILVVDRSLGVVLGLLTGILVVDVLLLIVSIIPVEFFQNLTREVQNTWFTKFLSNINIISLLFTSNFNPIEVIKKIVNPST